MTTKSSAPIMGIDLGDRKITITGGNDFNVARGVNASNVVTGVANISGGTLTSQGMRIASTFSNASTGSMTISGGTVIGTAMRVGNGSSAGTLTVSGTGSFSTSGIADFGTGANPTNNASLFVESSNASVSVGTNLFLRGRVETSFEMDAVGLGSVDVGADLFIGINNTGLMVDGTAFSGTGTFDLFTFDTTSGGSSFVNESLVGFAPGTA